MQLDTTTTICTVMTVFGTYAMFVSSKPITFGGVCLLIVLALSTTQAVMGISRSWYQLDVVEETKGGDVVDLIKWVYGQATTGFVGGRWK